MIVGTTIQRDITLARYTSAGQLDTGFGGTGVVVWDWAGGDNARSADVILQGNKILIAGAVQQPDLSWDSVLARFSSDDGSLDSSFGGAGVIHSFSSVSPADALNGLALQSDGRVVAVGLALDSSGTSDFLVARFLGDRAGARDLDPRPDRDLGRPAERRHEGVATGRRRGGPPQPDRRPHRRPARNPARRGRRLTLAPVQAPPAAPPIPCLPGT